LTISWKIRVFDVFSIILALIFSTFLTYQLLIWLVSIDANSTLKIVLPIIVYASSFFGLWVIYNFLKIFVLKSRGLSGYQLRGKMTLYMLIASLGSILVVGGLMFYLITLIESSFLEGEHDIAENLMRQYRILINKEKSGFEKSVRNLLETKPGLFKFSFKVTGNQFVFQGPIPPKLKKLLIKEQNKLNNFFSNPIREIYYFGHKTEWLILKEKGKFYLVQTPALLRDAFEKFRYYSGELSRLTAQKRNIRPISAAALVIFSVPILIAVFFLSFFFAKNMTGNIEKLAEATKIVAGGALNYRVRIKSGDELEELADSFNTMTEKLKAATEKIKRVERLEAWQEMARRLAHEIKNPLTPIKLSAERLQYAYAYKKDDFEAILDKTTNTVINETRRLENLVNEFSKFARLPQPHLIRKNIIETVRECVDFFVSAYPDFVFECDYDPGQVWIDYDSDQIKQVIINIISNAIEACHNCEKHVTIVSSAVNRFILAIEDHSGGIPDTIGDKIFEPYFTTKENGTGLGMAIAERIVVEHGGNLWFKVENENTIFYLELPFPKEDQSES